MRKETAEMLWLLLPAVILGGVGLFFKMRGPSQFDGPLRVELGKFQPTEVQPVDVFQGYRYQISSHVRLLGSPPDEMQKLSKPRWDGLYSVPILEAQRQGKWVPWGKKSPTASGVNDKEGELKVKIALPDKAPADVEALRVKGSAIGRFTVEVPAAPGAKPNGVYRTATGYVYGTNGRFHTQQKLAGQPFSELIWKRGQPWPQPKAKRNTTISLVQIGKVHPARDVGFYDIKCKPSDKRYFYIETKITGLEPDAPVLPVTVVRAELLDEKRRVLATNADRRIYVHYSRRSFVPSKDKQSELELGPGLLEGAYDDSISRKALLLRIYVSQNSEWPAHLDIPLREAWQSRNSRLLQLQKVKIIKSPPDVYPYGGMAVEVTLRYLGGGKLWCFNRDAASSPSNTSHSGIQGQKAAPTASYKKLTFEEQPYLRNEMDEVIENITWVSKDTTSTSNPVYSRDPVLQDDGTLTLLFPLQLIPGHKFKAANFHLNLGIVGDGVLKIRQPLPVQTLLQKAVIQPTATPIPQ